MGLHNMAGMSTTTTGTGTITLGSALTGLQSFADAGVVDGEVVPYAIKDSANWEVGEGVYTSSGTTLSRTTIFDSSNSGSAINLSGSGVEVRIVVQKKHFLVNSSVSPTTINVSAAVGNRYFADISGLTADRNFVLPTCLADDEIELKISVGDATYELVIIGDTGVSIEGGTAATEWSRLFISGEVVRFVADGTDSWQVVYDGRIPCQGLMTLSANETTNTAATNTLPTWDNAVINIGSICDLTNYRFNIRRAGYYVVSGCYMPLNNEINGAYISATVFLGGTGGTQIDRAWNTAGNATNLFTALLSPRSVLCAVGDYLDFWYKSENANKGAFGTETWFQVVEQ